MATKKRITKEDFNKLEFDNKCFILEELLPDDYYEGLHTINFWQPDNFEGNIGEDLPETPPEIKAEEDKKLNDMVNALSEKLFLDTNEIEYWEPN